MIVPLLLLGALLSIAAQTPVCTEKCTPWNNEGKISFRNSSAVEPGECFEKDCITTENNLNWNFSPAYDYTLAHEAVSRCDEDYIHENSCNFAVSLENSAFSDLHRVHDMVHGYVADDLQSSIGGFFTAVYHFFSGIGLGIVSFFTGIVAIVSGIVSIFFNVVRFFIASVRGIVSIFFNVCKFLIAIVSGIVSIFFNVTRFFIAIVSGIVSIFFNVVRCINSIFVKLISYIIFFKYAFVVLILSAFWYYNEQLKRSSKVSTHNSGLLMWGTVGAVSIASLSTAAAVINARQRPPNSSSFHNSNANCQPRQLDNATSTFNPMNNSDKREASETTLSPNATKVLTATVNKPVNNQSTPSISQMLKQVELKNILPEISARSAGANRRFTAADDNSGTWPDAGDHENAIKKVSLPAPWPTNTPRLTGITTEPTTGAYCSEFSALQVGGKVAVEDFYRKYLLQHVHNYTFSTDNISLIFSNARVECKASVQMDYVEFERLMKQIDSRLKIRLQARSACGPTSTQNNVSLASSSVTSFNNKIEDDKYTVHQQAMSSKSLGISKKAKVTINKNSSGRKQPNSKSPIVAVAVPSVPVVSATPFLHSEAILASNSYSARQVIPSHVLETLASRPPPPHDFDGYWEDGDKFKGKKSFGYFKCRCGKSWKSAYATKGMWQCCKGCETRVIPKYMWVNFEGRQSQRVVEDDGSNRGPHDIERCQRCIELGYGCWNE